MTSLIVEIARWLGNKFMILVVIVAILLATGWVAVEYVKLSERMAEAGINERVAGNLEQELGALNERRAALESELAHMVETLQEKRGIREQALVAEREARRRIDTIKQERRFYFTRLTHASYFARLAAAETAHAATARAADAAKLDFDTARSAFGDSEAGRRLNELNALVEERSSDIANLRAKASHAREEAAAHPLQRLRRQVVRVLPTALGILAVIILLPLVVKAVLYFVVAPFISRARPVSLLSEVGGQAFVDPASVSVPILLDPGDELIVHSNHLQAAGAGPGKRTRFLFSWRMPLTSIAAGLFLMVAVRNPIGQPPVTTIISPKSDLFDQLARIRLPDGAAMVVYPRSLVAVILRCGVPPVITRHWRIANLHAWLTFQLRYLVIHGPCEFVVKGCRGVRADAVSPENPRMQDQCATLGFSANLDYSSIRCETFIDYLRGRDGLFNDRFSNGSGAYLTEEIPDPRRKTGLFGRGIEGLVDGLLKGFGI
jgi:Skp family chaperone for outer membrane proteins